MDFEEDLAVFRGRKCGGFELEGGVVTAEDGLILGRVVENPLAGLLSGHDDVGIGWFVLEVRGECWEGKLMKIRITVLQKLM